MTPPGRPAYATSGSSGCTTIALHVPARSLPPPCHVSPRSVDRRTHGYPKLSEPPAHTKPLFGSARITLQSQFSRSNTSSQDVAVKPRRHTAPLEPVVAANVSPQIVGSGKPSSDFTTVTTPRV